MYFFWLEVTLSLIAPLILLSRPSIRQTAGGLYLTSVLVVLGFITNRLNVSITGQETAAGLHYVPKWTEIAVTGAMIAAGFALFGLATKYLPIFPAETTQERARTVEPVTTGVPTAALEHAGD
jgi:Ni/Fe-hydrogenase subunit HybB-like protein